MSDPIGDLATRIRNGLTAGKKSISAPYSKEKESILRVLLNEGYITGYSRVPHVKFEPLEIVLKYDENKRPAITTIVRISRPGLRDYRQVKELKPINRGAGTLILTTSKGVLSDRECKAQNVAGEVLLKVT